MRYFRPRLIPGWLAGIQDRPSDKFGGLPWGLPNSRWPICAACKKPQSLVMQIFHHPDRLDLCADGRVLFAFQCADWYESGCACDPFSTESGSTSCFVLEARDLSTGLSDPQTPVRSHVECRVSDWLECEDDHGDESQAQNVSPDTRLGGEPFWMYDPMQLPTSAAKWRFIAQVNELMEIEGLPPDPDTAGCTIIRMKGDGTVVSHDRPREKLRDDGPGTIWHYVDQNKWVFSFANFSGGRGYAFLSENFQQGCFAFSR
jgi:hypothetical protein